MLAYKLNGRNLLAIASEIDLSNDTNRPLVELIVDEKITHENRDEIMRTLIMKAWEQVETISRIISNGEQLKQMGLLPELSKPIIRSRQEYKLATFHVTELCKQNYGFFPSRDTLCNPIKWTGIRSFIITTMPSDRSKGETQLIRLVN